MSDLEANRVLIRRFIEEVVNTGDVSGLAEFVSEDCVATDGTVRVVSGVAGMAEHVLGVRQTYPDLRLSIQQQIAEGEWVATQVLATGTHRGGWLGMKPTGKVLAMVAVNMDRVVNGKLVEHGGAANMLEPLLEAGALRPA